MTVETPHYPFAQRVQQVPKSFIREILKVTSNPGIVSFAGGLPNPALFPMQELEDCAAKVFQKRGAQVLQYSETEGYYPLREYIAARYLQKFGLTISPEQILITSGSQQALDLLGKVFLNAGDKVLLERPTYLGALQCLSLFQAKFEEVTLNSDGVDPDELEEKMFDCNPKLFYCIPNYQNPTGLHYSEEKRKLIAGIAARYPAMVIEDDPYGDISFSNHQPLPIYSYLPEKTILLGSFSKTVAPGLRVGWMVADKDIIRKATIMKQASDLHSNNLSQHILYEFLSTYDLDHHVSKIVKHYKYQRDVMLSCIEEYFPENVQYNRPEGGMFTWLTLPSTTNAREFLKKAMEQDVIFVPGDSFYASSPDLQTLRLNFSNVNDTTMRNALRKLGTILEYTNW
ncbi:aminotransferase-like domain-containing protein [Desertivirga arenae]|uniref:aminotransferase-like domain-containing protein n=1 Tax=Desertivirga arenae TaxID=2810309 RepID=UPI001A960366|nr:PLP-dependent aminotransferase family protein [Pedobacter sp. SYSU D00823]